MEVYAKQTQTDVVRIGEKAGSEDEEEGDSVREQSSKESQRSDLNPHKDDTIEPEKHVSAI